MLVHRAEVPVEEFKCPSQIDFMATNAGQQRRDEAGRATHEGDASMPDGADAGESHKMSK